MARCYSAEGRRSGILASRSSARLKQCRTVAAQFSFSSKPARAGRAAIGRTMIMMFGTAKPKLSGAFIGPPLYRRAGPGSGRSPFELYSGQPTSDMQHRARKRWRRSRERGRASRIESDFTFAMSFAAPRFPTSSRQYDGRRSGSREHLRAIPALRSERVAAGI